MTALTIRKATPDDVPFVVNTWVRSFGPKQRPGWAGDPFMVLRMDYASHNGGQVSPGTWYDMHREMVRQVTERAEVLVAEHPDVPGTVLGWLVFERDGSQSTLHYVYVRKDAQRRGLGRRLLEASGALEADEVRATHMTKSGEALLADAMARTVAA